MNKMIGTNTQGIAVAGNHPHTQIIAHGFFATDALPADTSRATRERIAEVLTGRPAAEIW